jgi:hypothetical protein
MVAQPGNQLAKKLDTPELRKWAYESYCAHLAKGKSKKSWNLKTPVTLTWETMEKYIKDDPNEFDPTHKELAISDGFAIWEQVVEDSAIGKNKEANTASLQMLMRNKFSWDKRDETLEDKANETFLQAHDRLMNQLVRHQKGNLLDAMPQEPERPN